MTYVVDAHWLPSPIGRGCPSAARAGEGLRSRLIKESLGPLTPTLSPRGRGSQTEYAAGWLPFPIGRGWPSAARAGEGL